MLHRILQTLAGLTLPCLAVTAQIPLAPPAPPATEQGEQQPQTGPIQVQELASLNPDEIGLLDEQHGGLGLAMWKDSSLGLVSKALPMLPNQPGWRSLRALETRLLESAATLPAGRAAGEPMIALRVGKLAGMGVNDGVAALLKLLPSPAMTPILRRLQIDSLLLSGDSAGACAQESALRAGLGNDDYALQLQVFCHFLGGRGNEARLGIDLLRDQKVKDPLFFAAADGLSGLPPAKADGLAEATPIALAMASLAKLPLPESGVASAPAAYLPFLARAPGASLESRLIAAERAVGAGTATPELLRQTIEAMTFSPAELLAAGSETGKTAKGRALLYKAAEQQTLPAARAGLIQRALAADPGMASQLYAPMLAALPPSPDLAGFAPWAVRALVATGQGEAARSWLGVLRADAILSTGSANAAVALRPLLRLAGLADPLTSADLVAWKLARAESPGDFVRHSLLLLSLLSTLGDTPPENEWLALLDGPPIITGKTTRSALSVGLIAASAAKRRAETVMYVLLSLGEQREVEPAEFAQLVSALRAVGLDGDARALAVELALAYGI
jgi:hypothetical protein